MALIDDRGRVFGRINLIDFVVGVFLLALIPLAYGAFVLFKVPPPAITSISPPQIVEHGQGSIALAGEHIRPFLQARIGAYDAPAFLVQSPGLAELKLPDLPPGTYDIALYDQGEELVRKPAALTVLPIGSVSGWVYEELVGAFVGIAAQQGASLRPGSRFSLPPAADGQTATLEVLAIRRPEANVQRVPAVLGLSCPLTNLQCQISSTAVAPNATIKLPASGATQDLAFVIDSIGLAGLPPVFTAVAMVKVQFVAVPELLGVLKAGDVDIGPGVPTDRAALTEIGSSRTVTTRTTIVVEKRPLVEVDQPQVEFTGTLRVPVVFTAAGWSYREKPVKVGTLFVFETVSGSTAGWVVDVKLGAAR
jgi:hypothetical protein